MFTWAEFGCLRYRSVTVYQEGVDSFSVCVNSRWVWSSKHFPSAHHDGSRVAVVAGRGRVRPSCTIHDSRCEGSRECVPTVSRLASCAASWLAGWLAGWHLPGPCAMWSRSWCRGRSNATATLLKQQRANLASPPDAHCMVVPGQTRNPHGLCGESLTGRKHGKGAW